MFTFESREATYTEIKFDAERRDELIRLLTRLVSVDYEHLLTPSWVPAL
jgi:hypothetical protein